MFSVVAFAFPVVLSNKLLRYGPLFHNDSVSATVGGMRESPPHRTSNFKCEVKCEWWFFVI